MRVGFVVVPLSADEAWDRLPIGPLPFVFLGVLAAGLLYLRRGRSRPAASDVH